MSKRIVNGVLLLNKALHESSNQSLQKVKRLFSAKKAGHLGTLDPLASGMLPICFGEATKFAQHSINANKTYFVVAKLGIKTNSGDTEGTVLQERDVPSFSPKQIENVLDKFRGDIMQIPSMFSALKYQGQPLYKLARQGIEIERPPRSVTIFNLEWVEQKAEILKFIVDCSKGTYIRTLIDDMGDELGCGAHVAELHRLSVGSYTEDQMITFEKLQDILAAGGFAALDQKLLSLDTLVEDLPEIKLTSLTTHYLCQGQSVLIPNAPTEGFVKLITPEGVFLGIGVIAGDGKVAPKRLIGRTVRQHQCYVANF